MLSFAAEFPTDPSAGREMFIKAIRTWIIGSPHTKFSGDDLADLDSDGTCEIKKENLSIKMLSIHDDKECFVAFKHVTEEGDISWTLEVVFNNNGYDSWVAVRTSRESEAPSEVLPDARKPVVVRTLLEILGGGLDGNLKVSSRPQFLKNDDISLAAEFITGAVDCRLPVVYISSGFNGSYSVDPNAIANDLSGMAHVMVEPNRAFSYRLQADVSSRNVYGGMIGVYWPDATGRRTIFRPKDFSSKIVLKQNIVGSIRQALLNRRPLYECTWGFVQEKIARKTYVNLKNSGSDNLQDYIDAFDQEQTAKSEKISGLEKEIQRLQSEIRKYDSNDSVDLEIGMNVTSEEEFDEGEFLDVVLDVLSEGVNRLFSEGRRAHIINDIIMSNKKTGLIDKKKEFIKSIFRGYSSMSSKMKSDLEKIGFSVTDEGRHYKAIYNNDGRYTFSISKSGSDHRGGLNMASDIIKKIL